MGQSHEPEAHVLVIVQNLPVPLDRRVWLECCALKATGYEVSVICPKGPGDPRRQTIEGVRLFKYPPPPQAGGMMSYAWEFAYCWTRTAILSVVAWRERRFHVLQACNPPDTFWLLAMAWRPWGVRFVFDQHDLNPELFLSRFGQPSGLVDRMQLSFLRWLERCTYRQADRVVATNESYRKIAMTRGRKAGQLVTVVRSGPDTRVMRPVRVERDVWRGGDYLLAYLGIMGPQDGVEGLLVVMDELVRRRGRREVRMVLMGFGDCLEDLRRDCTARGLDDYVEFTGRVGPAEVAQYLSAADVGLCPDRRTPLNDVSTMNKTMEYMAYGLPSVSFDLAETRVSAGDTAIFVEDGDFTAFADATEMLLDDVELRVRLGLAARARVESILDWRPQADSYVSVFDQLLGRERRPSGNDPVDLRQRSSVIGPPGVPVDLAPGAMAAFLRSRGRPSTSRADGADLRAAQQGVDPGARD